MFFNTQKKTVDSVLLAFNDAVNDLEQVESDQLAEAELQQQTITYAEAAKEAALTEANRAKKVRSNILKLIGG